MNKTAHTRVILGKERMHAIALGDDLYRLENIPFFADDYALHDIVRAVAETDNTYPVVQELVTPSGNKTMQVYFPLSKRITPASICDALNKIGGIDSEGMGVVISGCHVRSFNVNSENVAQFEKVLDFAEALVDIAKD